MRIAITGASGNTGSALLRRLHRDPDITEIVGICRHPPVDGPTYLHEKVRWVAADVAHDDLAAHLHGADALVHLAWIIQPSRQPERLEAVNVTGTRRALQAAMDAGVRNLVVASSMAAYSPGPDHRIDESWPTQGIPRSLYSGQKVAVERMLDGLEAERADTRVVRMRPVAIFQRQAASEIVRHFLGPFLPRGLVRRGLLPILPLPPGFQVQDVHADDVAEAYALALAGDARGAFNLAGEPVLDGTRLSKLLRARVVHVPLRVLDAAFERAYRLKLHPTDPSWLRVLTTVPMLNTARARHELGWRPMREAGETLIELLDGMRDKATGPTPMLAEQRSNPVP